MLSVVAVLLVWPPWKAGTGCVGLSLDLLTTTSCDPTPCISLSCVIYRYHRLVDQCKLSPSCGVWRPQAVPWWGQGEFKGGLETAHRHKHDKSGGEREKVASSTSSGSHVPSSFLLLWSKKSPVSQLPRVIYSVLNSPRAGETHPWAINNTIKAVNPPRATSYTDHVNTLHSMQTISFTLTAIYMYLYTCIPVYLRL